MTQLALCLTHRATGFEGLGDLVIQLNTICNDNKGPVAGNLAEDFLSIENHRKAFPRSLRLPEYTASSMALLPCTERGSNCVVHTKKLVVLSQHFDQPSFVLGKDREV